MATRRNARPDVTRDATRQASEGIFAPALATLLLRLLDSVASGEAEDALPGQVTTKHTTWLRRAVLDREGFGSATLWVGMLAPDERAGAAPCVGLPSWARSPRQLAAYGWCRRWLRVRVEEVDEHAAADAGVALAPDARRTDDNDDPDDAA